MHRLNKPDDDIYHRQKWQIRYYTMMIIINHRGTELQINENGGKVSITFKYFGKGFPTRMGIRFTHMHVICFTTYRQNNFVITQKNNYQFAKQDSHKMGDQVLNAGKQLNSRSS